MSNHIPGLEKKGLLQKKWVAELVSSGPPVLVAGVGATSAFSVNPIMGGALGAGVVWLLGASTWKVMHARTQDEAATQKTSHDGLVGALHVLHTAIAHVCDIKSEDLRVTIHRVVPPLDNSESIEQIVPYVGGNGGGAGRTFSLRSGITGLSIRLGKPVAASRVSDDESAYREELKDKWGYTEKEARALSPDRRSFMAVPIRGKHHIRGVVYLDSTKRGAFESGGTGLANSVVSACSGINQYCNARYGE
jgi:hypothetical protein